MNVIPFRPRPAGERYDAARQRMLDEFLAWLRADPVAADIAMEEAASTFSCMQQLAQLAQLVKLEVRQHAAS